MKKNKFLILISIIILAVCAAYYATRWNKNREVTPNPENKYLPEAEDRIEADHVLLNVPFTSQAPLANWADPRQEDGCEEASLYMAWLWVNNKSTTPEVAEKEIIAMSDFQQSRYGDYHDTSAEDTAKVLKEYYGYDKFGVKIDPSLDDIKDALRDEKIVIVPLNGQILYNPFYKQPGPITHMIVIKGFDDSKGHFITNDPGTRRGEGFVYEYDRLYKSMVNYPTGAHGSQAGRPKAMISISK